MSILTLFRAPGPALLETATAIRGQSFQAFEWIIIADIHSLAGNARMLEDLSRDDSRIRVISHDHSDSAAAWRLGVNAARSAYLCEVTSAEMMMMSPTALERAIWALESCGVEDGAGGCRIQRVAPGLAAADSGHAQDASYAPLPLAQPFCNRLEKPAGTRRVLLMLPWLNVGGVEKFSCDLVEQLLERRHQVTLCTTLASDNAWLPRFTRLTPDIFSLPALLRLPDFPRFLLYLIDSRSIDVVLVSNTYLGYQLLPFLRSRRPDVTFVDYAHVEAEQWRNGGFARVSVAYQELLDLTVVSTDHLRRWMVKHGGEMDRIEVCHINVDTGLWDPARFPVDDIRRGLGIPDGAPMLLYAGRICPQKRPRVVADVVRRLAQVERFAFVCVVAGDGEDLPALRILVREYGLEGQVRFVGMVTPERMQELQAAADVFFLPSQYEGLSLALYEAMAMKTVPVAADVGGQRELVTSDCGFLIPGGDDEIDGYITAIRRLLEAPGLRRAMAAAGRERVVRHFTLESMGERMVESLARATALAQRVARPAVGPGLGLEHATLAIESTRLEKEIGLLGRRDAEAAATTEALRQRVQDQERQLAGLREGSAVAHLSGEEVAREIGMRRIVQAFAFRLASKRGFTWLRAFRGVGKGILGGR